MQRLTRLVSVTLILTMAFALTPMLSRAFAQGGTLAYGDVVTGSITAKNYFEIWQFSGSQGDRVRIVMTGDGNLDPYLGLIELSTEEVIAEDDDSAGNSNAMLDMSLPSSGDFAIIATRYDLDTGTSQGQYQLELQGSNATNVDFNSTVTEPVEIEAGIWYYGELELGTPFSAAIADDSYAHIYEVNLEAGQEFIAGMFADGSNLDSYLIFGLDDGTVLAEDDDSGAQVDGGGMYDAVLSLTVPETGTYMLIASRAGLDVGSTTGNYALIAGYADQGQTPTEPDPVNNQQMPPGIEVMGDVAVNAEITGSISQNSYLHLYTFDGNAGDQITITMSSADGLDAYLGILDPSDNVLAEDDDSGGGASGYDAQISIRLPESGTYVIVATRAGLDEGTSVGSYTLVVSDGAPQAPEGVTGLGGFGGLPGRAIENGGGTLYLRGTGRSTDPAKQSDLEQLLQPAPEGEKLPGRSFKTPDMLITLHGTGRTDNPAKFTPLEQLLSTF
ncbi:PPC domain-containing protein [Aggregatilinea lenta]|uniref:PPC domain-containing protein n=1 Tax=Aggregatilinea lenta TaxID=913108 RepID=UPI0013C36919|nr:PPC domain-containing protein [Aggregatilinea lenta]